MFLARPLSRLVLRPLRRIRRVWLVVAPIAIIALVLLMRMRSTGPIEAAEPFAPIDGSALTIDAPLAVGAGQGFIVTVEGIDAASNEIELLVETGYQLLRSSAPVDGGRAVFTVDAPAGPASGTFVLTALDGRQAATATVDYRPGTGVDPLELFLGPRTIEATTNHATMIVVVAQDRFGNPVAEGTDVHVTVTRPDLATDGFTIETEGLLAWRRIISGPLAGKSKVAVTVDDGRGEELDFLEIAGRPAPFALEQLDPASPADGRSLVRIRTGELADEFGNLLPDGLDVFADVTGPGGTRRFKSQIIGARAEFTIEAPARPGIETMVVTASGTISTPLEIVYGPMVIEFPAEVAEHPDGFVVTVGPIVSTLGSYVPDGTDVVVSGDFGSVSRQTLGGVADIVVPVTTAPIVVEVLGAEQHMPVPS